MRSFMRVGLWAACLSGMTLAASGCRSLGPVTVQRDRAEYSEAISDSWKRQTLLNIVKLRYLDPPIFVDVGQIVAGYSLETNVSLGASNSPEGPVVGGTTTTLGGGARFTDRPTVTYVPLTGNDFIRTLLTPLPPPAVFFMMQSGHRADAVLLAAVSSINGLKNQDVSLAGVAPPDPAFLRVLELLRQVQVGGGLGMRVEVDGQSGQAPVLMVLRAPEVSPETDAASQELRQLLRLDPEAKEFRLVFGAESTDSREIAVTTRSIIQQLTVMATQVEVPVDHVAEGRAIPGWSDTPAMPAATRFIHVQSGENAPDDAAVVVNYRGWQFWIDDRDLRSKRSFALIMTMFTLGNTGAQTALPLITIPAQ